MRCECSRPDHAKWQPPTDRPRSRHLQLLHAILLTLWHSAVQQVLPAANVFCIMALQVTTSTTGAQRAAVPQDAQLPMPQSSVHDRLLQRACRQPCYTQAQHAVHLLAVPSLCAGGCSCLNTLHCPNNTVALCAGFPRIGPNREMKRALERCALLQIVMRQIVSVAQHPPLHGAAAAKGPQLLNSLLVCPTLSYACLLCIVRCLICVQPASGYAFATVISCT